MTIANILTIIGFVVTLVLAASYVLSAYLANYRELNPIYKQEAVVDKIVEIYNLINNTMARTNASRIMILTTHNGNGQPTVFKSFKISALYGSNSLEDTKSRYINIPVDEEYTFMLQRLQVRGEVHLLTKEMPEGMLKAIYTEEGVKMSNIYKLAFTDVGMLYCSISSHEIEEWTSQDITLFKELIRNLQTMLEYEKVAKSFKNWFLRLIKIKRKR